MAETMPTLAAVPSTNNELLQNAEKDASCPFDDSLQRTKCLMQYIRIRKQRAENEIAKRNALRKQKKDAKVTLQNARDSLRVLISYIYFTLIKSIFFYMFYSLIN